MRYIAKAAEPPASIREWIEAQIPLGYNLSYDCFSDVSKLRIDLIDEQHGLCAYTGVPIDERLVDYQRQEQNLSFRAHIEHVKPRSICQRELEARGGVYGRELCEDMDYYNLVAALEVSRKRPARSEIFGAAAHENELLPVTPLQEDCEKRFQFDENGGIHGLDEDARATLHLLKLDHYTLTAWRRAAFAAFFPLDLTLTHTEVERLVEHFTHATDGKLPEFSFCLSSYARLLLG